MKKRNRSIVALLLVGCLIMSNGTVVSAKEMITKLGDGTFISLDVSRGQIWARTVADNSTTKVTGYRYASSGSPNQLIRMETVTGGDIVYVTPPSGWSIGKGDSYHAHGGFTATLTAFS